MFDYNIPFQLAFYALLEHGNEDVYVRLSNPIFSGTRAAPLWDSVNRKFVGLLTVTDFIDTLRHYHRHGTPMDVLSTRTIAEVLGDPEGRKLQHNVFVSASADCSISQACNLLREHGHRYLPVVAEDLRVLTIVSYHDIMRFIVNNFKEHRKLFEDSLDELGLGTRDNVLTVHEMDTLASVLGKMEELDVSSAPVVDDANKIVGVYSRAEIKFITSASDADGVIANLNLSLKAVLQLKLQEETLKQEDYITASSQSSLQSIIERFSQTGFHRAVFVDEFGKCQGVLSVRDLVVYLGSPSSAVENDGELLSIE